jgi:DNA processing protein
MADQRFIARVAATNGGVRLARSVLVSDDALSKHWSTLPPSAQDEATRMAVELEARGCRILTPGDDAWPSELDVLATPPPFLYAWGELGLLGEPAIGMCGSRDASKRGLKAARTAGEEAARLGMHVISGYARGVDTETHLAALGQGAGTVIVLAEGILHFRVKRVFRDRGITPDRVLVLSQFAPEQRWSAGAAMTRNGIICALGRALVVVEARDRGGTLNAGRQALKVGRPVMALQLGDETPAGNQLLFDEGAERVGSTGQFRVALRDLLSGATVQGGALRFST